MDYQDLRDRLEVAITKQRERALAFIEDVVRQLNVAPDDKGFRTAVVLVTAALLTGPDIDELVVLTHYPRQFVEDISRWMHASGRWTNGAVDAKHWFEGRYWNRAAFVSDVLIAEGCISRWLKPDGEWGYRLQDSIPVN